MAVWSQFHSFRIIRHNKNIFIRQDEKKTLRSRHSQKCSAYDPSTYYLLTLHNPDQGCGGSSHERDHMVQPKPHHNLA